MGSLARERHRGNGAIARSASDFSGARCIRLEKIEILVLLPGRRLVTLAPTGFLEPLRKPARLAALELEEIIAEPVPAFGAKERIALDRLQLGRQTRWKQRALVP